MTQDDRGRFASSMGILLAAFGRAKSEDVMQAYWVGCRSLDIDQFERAVTTAVETGGRMPAPADLRAIAHGAGRVADAEATRAKATENHRCKLHQRDPASAPHDWNWWCDICRRHRDRNPERTASQQKEIHSWAKQYVSKEDRR